MPPTVSTRFLVISDTHNFDFDNKANAHVRFQHPLPKADVLLHCGDLTMAGGLSAYKGVLKMLGSIEAELKLVIAGNHDLSLDGPYWRRTENDEDDGQPGEHEKAMEIMTGPLAKQAGVTYLEEGMHTFTLKNGAKFNVYASPYQPEFCGFAFPYERDEDRFNPPQHVNEGVKPIAINPIPDFPAVDIMMTHGPPKGILDPVYEGRMTAHVGCDALMTAVSRARPRMYCFGHIHEGHGANLITWKDDKKIVGKEAIKTESDQVNFFPQALDGSVTFGKQTLMVNAAIMTVRYKPDNAPWLVNLDLPKGTIYQEERKLHQGLGL
jgi:predicted phosphohydrolase